MPMVQSGTDPWMAEVMTNASTLSWMPRHISCLDMIDVETQVAQLLNAFANVTTNALETADLAWRSPQSPSFSLSNKRYEHYSEGA
jgi:hypothetical protein